MSDNHIFVVIGSTGEYSDHQEWPVASFDTEQAAQEHIAFLSDTWRILKGGGDLPGWTERQAAAKQMEAFDPSFKCDYTDSRYYFWKVPHHER